MLIVRASTTLASVTASFAISAVAMAPSAISIEATVPSAISDVPTAPAAILPAKITSVPISAEAIVPSAISVESMEPAGNAAPAPVTVKLPAIVILLCKFTGWLKSNLSFRASHLIEALGVTDPLSKASSESSVSAVALSVFTVKVF